MTGLIHDDFLLQTAAARRLYHGSAAGLPIVDFHSHLDPGDLADDRRFDNLAQLWLARDPYKHRAMRMAGVPERCITGEASDREKFDAWAATVPQTLGNPLFHWTALELARYFGVAELLCPESAGRIWGQCNERLRSDDFSARRLLARANVECLCTSDRPQDDLEPHARLLASGFTPRVLPSLRIDDARAWKGDDSPGVFQQRALQRLDDFEQRGCRLADIALDEFVYRAGEPAADVLRFLGCLCGHRGWILQLHLGAQRATSTRLRKLAGPAGGYATIGNSIDIASLCRYLDDLEQQGCLPKTIVYPLNPADYAAVATLCGSYAEDGVRGKVQFGPAWWYNDHAWGIRSQLEMLSSYGLLSAFVGMTTDSRNLLSMSRHEYFRRLLCDFLGAKIEAGELPRDDGLLGRLVRDVCYDNARRWILGAPAT